MQGPDEPVDHDSAAIGFRLRRATVAVGVGALVAAASGQAADQRATLPSPFLPVRAAPPLPASAVPTETRFPGRLSTNQAVRVSIDRSGKPFHVLVFDRIEISGKGDYSFVVPAPVEDVRVVAGSASEPGLRSGAVVWQGFSPGRRLLSAAVMLRTAAAASALPLRIEIQGPEVRLVNTTYASATVVDAKVSAGSLAGALDAARAALELGIPAPAQVVDAAGAVRQAQAIARVPVRVRGVIRFTKGPPRTLEEVVARRPLQIEGRGDVRTLELSVSVPRPASLLRPPGAHRWVGLARTGRLAGGRKTTRLAESRLLSAALAGQFQEFLANPDLNGVARTAYRYVLVERPQAATVEPSGGTSEWPVAVAVALGVIAAAVGGLVLWAHS